MPPICRGRPRNLAPASTFLGSASPGPKLALPAPPAPSNNDFFQEVMWTYIERIRDYAPAASLVPVKARDNSNRSLKPWNPNLYYSYLYMECYCLCQQCKNNFKVARSQGHKRVPFAAGFLKNCILNQWQQYKTRKQCNQLGFLSWDEFKAFLRKNLGESDAFISQIWAKFRSDF